MGKSIMAASCQSLDVPGYPDAMVMTAGEGSYHDMPDGWKIFSETFSPPEAAKAVLLYVHGYAESTQTLSVRRLAHVCIARGIALVTYDMHGHGLSLEKNGLKMPEVHRGCVESFAATVPHAVEMA